MLTTLALGALLAAGAPPEPEASSALAPPDSAAWFAAGWTPADAAQAATPTGACAVQVPSLERARALPLFTRPAEFPRPTVACGTAVMALPVDPIPALLAWDGPAGAPASRVTWQVDARARGRDGTIVVDLDVPPLSRPVADQAAATEGAGVLFPAPEDLRSASTVRPKAPRTLPDPSLLQSSANVAVHRLQPDPVRPVVTVARAASVERDALLATLDGGSSWVEVVLAESDGLAAHHRLLSENLHVGQLDGRPALLVSPVPTRPRGTLALLAVTQGPEGPVVTDLGSPLPPGAPWRSEVEEARTLADGRVEAIVLVRNGTTRDIAREPLDGTRNGWGSIQRRSPTDGAWGEALRFVLPEGVRSPRLSWSPDGRTLVLFAEGRLAASRPAP